MLPDKSSIVQTLHEFISLYPRQPLQCRVERAKTLLLSGKHSIAEIAQKVGFGNQVHLNVHIKRSLGVTPKKILEQSKNR